MIASASLGALGTTLFAGQLARFPDASPLPAPVTRVIEYPGEAPADTMEAPTWALSRPRCQVVVHAATYEAADARATAIARTFAGMRRDTWLNGARYLRVDPIQLPFDLGPDAQGNARVAFNVAVMRAEP